MNDHAATRVDYFRSEGGGRWLYGALALLLLSNLLAVQRASAQQYPVGSDRGVDGKEMFAVCGFCHGPQGQGGQALDAPPLAGAQGWYVTRQLNLFRARQRGMHPDDVTGLQMSIVSGMLRNSATISNVAAYIEALPLNPPAETIRGEPAGTARPFIWKSRYAELVPSKPADASRGAAIYKASCEACHAANGQGNVLLNSPRITHLPAWYLHRQLQYFRDGVRGNSAEDAYGSQMAPFAKMLTTDQAIADVSAYVESLRGTL